MSNIFENMRARDPVHEDEPEDDEGDYDAFSDYAAGLYTGRQRGAAVAFGLMGMAEAIRISHHVWERPKPCTCSVRHGHFSHCAAK